MPAALPTEADVVALLSLVIDPELGSDIVDLGMAGVAEIRADGHVEVWVKLTIGGCPLRAQIKKDVESRVATHPGVTTVHITWDEMNADERSAVMTRARWNAREKAPDTEIGLATRVLAISSGKGGVGKSSVTVNVAAALAQRGFTVGVLDADIWGFSVPRMVGVTDRLEARRLDGSTDAHNAKGDTADGLTADGDEASDSATTSRPKIIPNELTVGPGMLKVVSTGMLVDDEGTALMWRGLMLTKAVEQFLTDVAWGDLDYLLIDMPPGTGDVQMGLARMLPRTDLIIVTTPAIAAQKVAIRAADMARRSFLRVVGVIENMSAFVCEHGTSYALFGEGGGAALADEIGAPLIGQVPLEPAVAAGGDNGRPVSVHHDGAAALEFRRIAERIATDIAPAVVMDGCTARTASDPVHDLKVGKRRSLSVATG
jgi:ATP-binding protein involved in chromosome partitioning